MRAVRAAMHAKRGAAASVIANGVNWEASDVGACAFGFNSNGTCYVTGLPAGPVNWYTPTTVGAGNTVWIEATLSSGNTPSGSALGTRLQLNAARGWDFSAANRYCVLTIKFYDAASGGNLLGTNTLSMDSSL